MSKEVTLEDLRKAVRSYHTIGGELYQEDKLESQRYLAAFDHLVAQAKMSQNILQLVIDKDKELHIYADELGRLTFTVIDEKTVIKANLLNRLETTLKEKNTVYLNQTNEGAISIDVSGIISEHSSLVDALKVVAV